MNGGIKVGKTYIREWTVNPVRPSPIRKDLDTNVEDLIERKLQDLQGKAREYNVEDLIERAKKMLDNDLLLKFLEYFEDLIEDSTGESMGELAIKKEDVRELLEEHLIDDLLQEQRERLAFYLEDSVKDVIEIIAEDMVKEEAQIIAKKIIELIEDTLKEYCTDIREIEEIQDYAGWEVDLYNAREAIISIVTREVLGRLVKETIKNIAKTVHVKPKELFEDVVSHL